MLFFRYWRPGAEHVNWKLNYKFFGFIFLQDMVDRGITEVQINETIESTGMFLQMFPYPCYIYDRLVALSFLRKQARILLTGFLLVIELSHSRRIHFAFIMPCEHGPHANSL